MTLDSGVVRRENLRMIIFMIVTNQTVDYGEEEKLIAHNQTVAISADRTLRFICVFVLI